jgi:hypothetical protein
MFVDPGSAERNAPSYVVRLRPHLVRRKGLDKRLASVKAIVRK